LAAAIDVVAKPEPIDMVPVSLEPEELPDLSSESDESTSDNCYEHTLRAWIAEAHRLAEIWGKNRFADHALTSFAEQMERSIECLNRE
jgi:hypothetical protein